MRTAEVKRRFLAHFEANGHTVVPSAPLPAIDDPNLLFVNAGMVQFVPYFLGQQTPPFRRAVSVQKCIRTPDIDEVAQGQAEAEFDLRERFGLVPHGLPELVGSTTTPLPERHPDEEGQS